MIYPKSKVTVTALTVTTEITEEDEGDPRMIEVSLHDDEAPGLISITDKNKDDSSVAFFVEQWAALRGAVDQMAGCARTHDEVMGKPRESSDGGLEMALSQASAYIERLQSQKRHVQHAVESLHGHLREHAEREGGLFRFFYDYCGTLLKEMAESEMTRENEPRHVGRNQAASPPAGPQGKRRR